MSDEHAGKSVLHLPPGAGRCYELGRMTAVFKADEDETAAAAASRNGGWSLAPTGRARMRMK